MLLLELLHLGPDILLTRADQCAIVPEHLEHRLPPGLPPPKSEVDVAVRWCLHLDGGLISDGVQAKGLRRALRRGPPARDLDGLRRAEVVDPARVRAGHRKCRLLAGQQRAVHHEHLRPPRLGRAFRVPVRPDDDAGKEPVVLRDLGDVLGRYDVGLDLLLHGPGEMHAGVEPHLQDLLHRVALRNLLARVGLHDAVGNRVPFSMQHAAP
mmetsp:Transcript_12610/g.30953  ORF Transcript_12610/g.30953 Transcript_12610/m.30953 type:complete len:210 (-) Transcript_12610:504-1133(-)